MRRNLSAADRLFRLVLSLTLLPLALVLDGDARLIGLIGVLPLTAAILGWSPVYALCRVRGNETNSAELAAPLTAATERVAIP